jgi:tetratricopeptide (TPR) repeat protein
MRWLEKKLRGVPLPPRVMVTLGAPYRSARLGVAVGLGRIARLRQHGWWPFLTTLIIVFIILVGGPLLLGVGVSLLEWLGVPGVDPAPTVGQWISFTSFVLLTLVVLFGRWLLRARDRVVVESFVDFTKDEATAVSGLSTLLVTELGRLRGLYRQIDDLSVPTAVGVERHGGFGRGKEAGDFLTVSADDRTDVLQSVVSSDTSLQLGPAKIPIGPIFNFLGRLARGPRVVGSVHLTEAGGGPTLTAQLVGKELSGTWRVDQKREPESEAERKAFLDSMVRDLACQMFTQISLKNSVRWQAVEPFNEYLRLYGASRRTPRDRASFLKQAQERLLEAVAEDESFDLAYYNLGVIYTQLAHTERLAEEQSEDATSRADLDRSGLEAARLEAARAAFARAISKNPDRWEAYYALAVTIFGAISQVKIDEKIGNEADVKQSRDVTELCNQVLAVCPGQGANLAAVYDLRGMAQVRLCEFGPAMASHRRAMHHAWIEYCRARRADVARPTGQAGLTEHARANATAALHNLAFAYERRAATTGRSLRKRLDRSTSQALFKWAGRRAGEGSLVSAACRFERGAALEKAGKYRRAEGQFQEAARIQPLNVEYQARRAKALAKEARRLRGSRNPLLKGRRGERADRCKEEAEGHAREAMDLLARPFSRAVAPFAPDAVGLRCDATLDALEKTYDVLAGLPEGEIREPGSASEQERIKRVRELKQGIHGASTETDEQTGLLRRRKKPREGAEELSGSTTGLLDWERDQVELAMGRLYAEGRAWGRALAVFTELVRRLTERDEVDRLIEFGVYAHKARALREGAPDLPRKDEIARYVEALETAAEGVRRDPLDVESRREAGRAHSALGQFSDALASLKHALWLSPSDPYLHYELGMCYRRLAQGQSDEADGKRLVGCASSHFHRAQELFDGEDLEGESWARFWRGKVALEANRPAEALQYLRGAEHGSAEAAAALLAGEAHLALDQRPAADHAFGRSRRALLWMQGEDGLRDHPTIDWLWGDELPWKAVEARIQRGKAEAVHLAPGEWQSRRQVKKAERLVKRARRDLAGVEDDDARDAAMARVLDTGGLLLRVSGRIDRALDLVRQRLRYEKTPEALRVEAELLDLRARWGKRLPQTRLAELAAEHTWKALSGDGRPNLPPATLRSRLWAMVGGRVKS